MAEKVRNNAFFRVCVDKAESGRFSGRVYSWWLSQPLAFSDLGGLVLGVEELMDAKNMPQAFQRSRSFSPRTPKPFDFTGEGLTPQEMDAQKGAFATFCFVGDSRLSSSWQGEIDWLNGERQPFSSVLDLIFMVDTHLSGLV